MKKIFTILTTTFLFLVSFSMVSAADTVTSTSTPAPEKYTLYVRQGCPHCANVEAFLNSNNLNSKVDIKETFNNDTNQKALEAAFKKFNTSADQSGVPFLVVSDTEYYVGDQPIINFFAKKYNIKVKEPTTQTSAADTIFLIIGGGLIFAVLGYGLYSVFSNKK